MKLSIIALLALALAAPVAAQQSQPAPERSITLTASGHVEAIPDMLRFNATVQVTARDLASARAEADQAVGKILKLARSVGLTEDDVDSSRMQARPEYEWRGQQRRYLGETVIRTVEFTVRDLDQYPELARRLTELPVTQISNPRLNHSAMDQLRLQAQQAALARGRIKAETIAGSIGAELGEVTSVVESGVRHQPQPRMMMAEAAMADAGSDGGYSYGKQRIEASVEMRFSLR